MMMMMMVVMMVVVVVVVVDVLEAVVVCCCCRWRPSCTGHDLQDNAAAVFRLGREAAALVVVAAALPERLHHSAEAVRREAARVGLGYGTVP